MSYAEAKEIALLRLELRACWDRSDPATGRERALRLAQVAGNDNELVAEARRWAARFG
jgi:endonuclease I